jgi:hypothetical protein
VSIKKNVNIMNGQAKSIDLLALYVNKDDDVAAECMYHQNIFMILQNLIWKIYHWIRRSIKVWHRIISV